MVTRLAGIGGIEATPVREFAEAVGRTEAEVRRAKERALAKIRRHLADSRNPFYADWN